MVKEGMFCIAGLHIFFCALVKIFLLLWYNIICFFSIVDPNKDSNAGLCNGVRLRIFCYLVGKFRNIADDIEFSQTYHTFFL